MFTISQIQSAHAKVKSGTDFPAYVQDLICLGILRYYTYLADGSNVYLGENGYSIAAEGKYPPLLIAPECNKLVFLHYLKIHQQGETDYASFCRDAATAGIYRWTVDLQRMTCTYFDKPGNEILSENFFKSD